MDQLPDEFKDRFIAQLLEEITALTRDKVSLRTQVLIIQDALSESLEKLRDANTTVTLLSEELQQLRSKKRPKDNGET
jgi:predicted  nucleic acid-binding Zn-ribbon protein